jgi:hypothetical protein
MNVCQLTTPCSGRRNNRRVRLGGQARGRDRAAPALSERVSPHQSHPAGRQDNCSHLLGIVAKERRWISS